MSIYLGNNRIDSNSCRNVGDIFYSIRTDVALAGAVKCDGNIYSTNDFTGNESIGSLLTAGKIPYLSLAEYEEEINLYGVCGKFGWDENTIFRVPTLNGIFLEAGNNNGAYISEGLPNITGTFNIAPGVAGRNDYNVTGAFVKGTDTTPYAPNFINGSGIGTTTFNASRSNPIYGNSTHVQPNSVIYTAFVQLASGANNQALETCTTVLSDVSDMKNHRVIAFQIPTADNNYNWYRKYADGWVEQGGFFGVNTSAWASDTITYPVTMANLNYQLIALGNWSDAGSSSCKVTEKTTSTAVVTYANNLTSIQYSVWQVTGMYA